MDGREGRSGQHRRGGAHEHPRVCHRAVRCVAPRVHSFVTPPARAPAVAPGLYRATHSGLRTCSATGSTIAVARNFALELAFGTSRGIGSLDLSRLRAIIVGSEAVRADTLERFAEAFEPSGFRPLAFCPGYGLAEATLAVTLVRPDEPWRSIPRPADGGGSGGTAGALVSTGSALAGVDVRVA